MDSEGPDQTARLRSLIGAFLVRICPKTRFPMTRLISHTVTYLYRYLPCFEITVYYIVFENTNKVGKSPYIKVENATWVNDTEHTNIIDKECRWEEEKG